MLRYQGTKLRWYENGCSFAVVCWPEKYCRAPGDSKLVPADATRRYHPCSEHPIQIVWSYPVHPSISQWAKGNASYARLIPWNASKNTIRFVTVNRLIIKNKPKFFNVWLPSKRCLLHAQWNYGQLCLRWGHRHTRISQAQDIFLAVCEEFGQKCELLRIEIRHPSSSIGLEQRFASRKLLAERIR